VWPKLSIFNLQSLISQILTTLSQPQETITWFSMFGENLTQLTHSLWPFWLSSKTNLLSPKVFQRMMLLSREPETIWRLSAEKETERTSPLWPMNLLEVVPSFKFQRRRVLSQEAEIANSPSVEITTSWTKWLWPWRDLLATAYLSSPVNCQTMIVLSREAVRKVSCWTWEVEIAVTHPEWPFIFNNNLYYNLILSPSFKFFRYLVIFSFYKHIFYHLIYYWVIFSIIILLFFCFTEFLFWLFFFNMNLLLCWFYFPHIYCLL
jgi:hypothetical protein